MKSLSIIFLLLWICLGAKAQQKQFTFQSANAMFPNNKNNAKYPTNDRCFNHNSANVYVPRHFD